MHLAELDSSSCPHYSVCFNLNIWIAFWVMEARKMLKSHVHIWVCLHQDKSDASEIYRVIPMWVDAGSGVFGRFNLCCVICYCSLYCLCSVLFCMKLPIKKGESQLLLNEFNSDLIKNHEAAVSLLSLLSFNWSIPRRDDARWTHNFTEFPHWNSSRMTAIALFLHLFSCLPYWNFFWAVLHCFSHLIAAQFIPKLFVRPDSLPSRLENVSLSPVNLSLSHKVLYHWWNGFRCACAMLWKLWLFSGLHWNVLQISGWHCSAIQEWKDIVSTMLLLLLLLLDQNFAAQTFTFTLAQTFLTVNFTKAKDSSALILK